MYIYNCHWDISWAQSVCQQSFQACLLWFVWVAALPLWARCREAVSCRTRAATTSRGGRSHHNSPALWFLAWSPPPCYHNITLATLWWEWKTKTCDLPLSLKLRAWLFLLVYQRKLLPPKIFLYINRNLSDVERQSDLKKYPLSLKQLVTWTEPVLSLAG